MNKQLFDWPESTWLILDQWGIIIGLFVSVLTIVLAITAWFRLDRIKSWFSRNSFPSIGGEIGHKQWDGIVFTVSNTETPKWVIDSCQPKMIALLATKQSSINATEICEYAEAKGIEVLDTIILGDVDDIKESESEISHLISRLRSKSCQTIAIDLTGGKTTMSLGAFMAAEQSQVTSLYVSTEYDNQLKKPIMSTAKCLAVSVGSS